MIERLVLIKLKSDYTTPQARTEIVRYSQAALERLPGVQSVDIGVPADAKCDGSWDLALRLRFADLDAATAYVPHPQHREYVDEYLSPRMEMIKAWNFRVTANP